MDRVKRQRPAAERRRGPGERTAGGTTVIAESAWLTVFVCVGCGLGGGWLITLLAGWLTALPWAPLQGPAELITSVPEPGLTLGGITVGGLLGLLVGFLAVHEALTVAVHAERVVLTVRDSDQEFTADRIALAVRDGRQLVLLDPDGREHARERSGLSWRQVAEAFRAHGYAWADEDPYREDFRRWVPGTPGLPEGADALLIARAEARKKDDSADAHELRRELNRLGVAVRDEGRRQYWRTPRRP
ncbi:hypothetical protein ACIQNG_14200 [Streptomyces sp. NPDC091377]|uniref:YqeB family protein n=1 Tax=Streptomyces sp. NPDC091377 TaxID=3365995 RepID=UPI00380934BA